MKRDASEYLPENYDEVIQGQPRFHCCEGCFRPAKRRLATMQTPHYECYAESYVKCFWNLCDHQSSTTSFLVKSKGHGILQCTGNSSSFQGQVFDGMILGTAW
ncbi:Bone morphogenetic protein 10 [Operophtera brumata]|uniref:Bone morphogenetic protein 10 n=1 Tax=Operophtera brumata TaxID=104452 RepID=A0A0L7L0Q5_OPEBR|nr:Bone morphogenetic protein 10 [Operophtera brumata]